MDDRVLFDLAVRVGDHLRRAGARLAVAESCTGGWLAKAITDVAGSSEWFQCGFVTYSNEAKARDLGVSPESLRRHGAVSEAVVREMAAGALRVGATHVSVSISGIAGPDGGTLEKPVGTVWFCTAVRRSTGLELGPRLEHFRGDREAVRRGSVAYALELLLKLDLKDLSADPRTS